jgi:integrase
VAQRDARLKTICRFARYVQPEDGRHEVPPAKHFGTHHIRRVPHIYSREEITRLIDATRQLGPPEQLHPHTYATLIALLAVTGLRIAEALSLQQTDVTPRGLVIRKTKFQKTRLVPLHDTAQAGLDRYLTCRRHVISNGEHVFVTDDGRPLRYREVYPTFQTLVKFAGLVAVSGHRPRLHELRQHAGSRIMPGRRVA